MKKHPYTEPNGNNAFLTLKALQRDEGEALSTTLHYMSFSIRLYPK